MKRLLDVVVAATGLTICLPLIAVLSLAIWLQDGHSPFYVPYRVGRGGRKFRMIKLRSMTVRADAARVDSTANDDPRITKVGRAIRLFKLDELPQFWHVVTGDMSLVGPRPNIERETRLYSVEERRLLDVKPGITDIASIVFADEGKILEGKPDPNIAYNQLIRPYKSRFGLLYVGHVTVALDLKLMALTLLNVVDRRKALDRVARIVAGFGGSPELVLVARREGNLDPAAPPGLNAIVTSRGC